MKAKYLSVTITLFLTACSQHNKPAGTDLLSQNTDIILRTSPDFSGVILLADEGTPVYHKAFGYKTFRNKSPLDTSDIFELASLSKAFTAMVIMMLNEEGRLSYDDLVQAYIPELPYTGITIRHLLTHTSGLPDYQAVMDAHWDKSSVAGNAESIEYLIKHFPKKHFAPGERYEYSNTGYMLLASIAEQASGEDFIELCRQRIFRPLGMSQTDIRTREQKQSLDNMAWGHLHVAEKQTYIHADSFPDFNYSIWLGNRKGPGRVSSSAGDLLKWDQALYNETLIKKETLAEGLTPVKLNDGSISHYGFGWRLDMHPVLGKKIFHAGDNPGYKTILIRYVDARKTLIMLSNNAHEKFHDMAAAIEEEISKGHKVHGTPAFPTPIPATSR